uniref:Uncharacterized protein n=1 Tax=Strix occidentalis caurina TaxID=311401 RepID=A0A8D0EUP1_STROC
VVNLRTWMSEALSVAFICLFLWCFRLVVPVKYLFELVFYCEQKWAISLQVEALQGYRVIDIASSEQLIIFTGLGEVYTWGDNDEGQLGDGTTNAIQRPRLVAALQGKKINRVACGSAHTLAWSTSKPANAGKLPTQVIFLSY